MIPTILTRGLGLLLLPIYARAFTPGDYGVLDLIGTIGPFLHVLICLEITQGYVRNRVDTREEDRRRLTGTSWLFSLAGYVIFLTIALPFSHVIAEHFLGSPKWSGAVFAGIFSLSSQNLMNMFIGQFRWELRSSEYSLLASIFALTSITSAAFLALVLHAGIVGILWGQTGAALLVTVIALRRLRKSWEFTVDFSLLLEMLRFSWPLVPASLAVFVSIYANRFALNHYAGVDEVGMFGMGARIAGVVVLLTSAIQSSVTPLIYERYERPETPGELAKIFTVVSAFSLAVCFALQIFARDIITLIATEKFLPSASIVAPMALALILNQLYAFTPGIAIARRTVQQLGITIASAVVGVIANIALVPPFGPRGAALASLASAGCFFALWAYVSQRHYPIPFEASRLLIILVAYLVGACTVGLRLSQMPTAGFQGLTIRAVVVVLFTLIVSAAAVLSRGIPKAGSAGVTRVE